MKWRKLLKIALPHTGQQAGTEATTFQRHCSRPAAELCGYAMEKQLLHLPCQLCASVVAIEVLCVYCKIELAIQANRNAYFWPSAGWCKRKVRNIIPCNLKKKYLQPFAPTTDSAPSRALGSLLLCCTHFLVIAQIFCSSACYLYWYFV